MRDVTTKNFGLLIAYVIPGFTVLWAVSPLSPTLQQWLGDSAGESPTVGGFLYVTLASVAAGMGINALRWLVVDHLHHATGIRRSEWNFSLLQEQVAAFDFVNEHQYRHYQHHSAMLIAAAITLGLRRWTTGPWDADLVDLMLVVVIVLFWLASRDNLRKYYTRVATLLGKRQQ